MSPAIAERAGCLQGLTNPDQPLDSRPRGGCHSRPTQDLASKAPRRSSSSLSSSARANGRANGPSS